MPSPLATNTSPASTRPSPPPISSPRPLPVSRAISELDLNAYGHTASSMPPLPHALTDLHLHSTAIRHTGHAHGHSHPASPALYLGSGRRAHLSTNLMAGD